MEIDKKNFSEIYGTSVLEESEPAVSSISIPRIREPRDMVYSGTVELPLGENAIFTRETVGQNRKHKKRKISPFTVVLILFSVAIISVFYIGNILMVGRLLNQINQLQIKHRQIVNQQELLKAQINKLSNLDRIQQIAHDKLGLQNSKQLPVWIEIDPEQIELVEETVQLYNEHKK